MKIDLEKYCIDALQLGARYAEGFDISQIAFDSRTILKCIFGCEDYGKIHTCPNQRSKLWPWQYKEILIQYQCGIVIGTNDKALSQKVSYQVEKLCFLDGHYFAFSLSDCAVCACCALSEGKNCRSPKTARPAFHSVGIDVFKTVRGLGMPIQVLQDMGGEENWYSAVFIN